MQPKKGGWQIKNIIKDGIRKLTGSSCWRNYLAETIMAAAAFHVGNRVSWLYHYCYGQNELERMLVAVDHIEIALQKIMPSGNRADLAVGLLCALAAVAAVRLHRANARKYRRGREFGSARWGTPQDIQPYINPVFRDNVILTNTERLTMESRPKNPKYARNKNVMVIGGSGSGKSRFFVLPNLMQMGERVSYIVTDPKGALVVESGRMLEREGYKIRILNTIHFEESMRYNPFRYIHSEKDILKLVTIIIENTSAEGKASDPFWTSAEKLLLSALIGYIWSEGDPQEQNMATLLDMINAFEVREDDENFQNPIDLLFADLEEEKPDHFAVRQYKRFKLAAGKTAKSILITCGARLAPFDIKELRELMSDDEMEIEKIGLERTAVFIIISDTDTTFHFVAAMFYSQNFDILCDTADSKCGGRLPYHVRILADEFANIGKIPHFDKLIATIRSREISVSIILQAKSQLKTMYKDAAATIEGNCDSLLFLGGKEESTLKELSELLGKETIDYINDSETRSRERSTGQSFQKTGRELMSKDELAVMDGSRCILQLRGVRPFLSEKFDITKHERYRELSDCDPKNAFDVKAYVSRRCRVLMSDEFECYEVEGME